MTPHQNISFSIVLPTYNRAFFLPRAIESVLAQTYTMWELVIIDDGSTDNSREVIEQFNDYRIKYFYQENAERSVARNHGIEQAKNEWICFMDSDSTFLPERLSNFSKYIKQFDAQSCLIYTNILYKQKNNIKNIVQKGKHFNSNNIFNELALSIIATPQVCIHSKILNKYKFNSDIRIGEDMELWLRIINEYPIRFLEEKNPSVIENVHAERSVQKYGSSVLEDYATWNYIFSLDKKENISKTVKRKKKAILFLNLAIYYALNNFRYRAFYSIILSLLNFPISKNTKYRINVLICVLFNRNRINKLIKD